MIKIFASSLLIVALFSGCATIKEYNQGIEDNALSIIYPTKAEYDAILMRAETESVPDPHHSGKKWLLVDTDEKSGKKTYVDTYLVLRNKNTAASDVKVLNADQSYQINYYKFFCYEGYGRKQWGYSYTADHKKKLQIPGFGPGEDHDRRPYKSEESFAKVICALGGFYRGSTVDS